MKKVIEVREYVKPVIDEVDITVSTVLCESGNNPEGTGTGETGGLAPGWGN